MAELLPFYSGLLVAQTVILVFYWFNLDKIRQNIVSNHKIGEETVDYIKKVLMNRAIVSVLFLTVNIITTFSYYQYLAMKHPPTLALVSVILTPAILIIMYLKRFVNLYNILESVVENSKNIEKTRFSV